MKKVTALTNSARRVVAREVERLVDGAVAARLERVTGLTPIDRTKPTDVHICGYPKSGNTWFQHLVATVVYGVNVELAPDTLLNELVPDVHFKPYYRRFGDPCFFKSHHLPRQDYRRIVYLLRDGRDAMVSYYHHLSATSGPIDFQRLVEGGEGLFPGKWHAHVDGYLSNPFGADMIVIRYEDLKRDPLAELRRFCQFAGLERDEGTLAIAVGRTAFDRMQSKEKKSGGRRRGGPRRSCSSAAARSAATATRCRPRSSPPSCATRSGRWRRRAISDDAHPRRRRRSPAPATTLTRAGDDAHPRRATSP